MVTHLYSSNTNDKLAQMLLAQITSQLQTLAAISPSVFQKVQNQLASTAQVPSGPNLNLNDPSTLLATLKQLTAPPTPVQPVPSQYPGQPVQHSVVNQNIQQQQPPQLSIQSMIQALSSQQQTPSQVHSQINASSANPYTTLLSNLPTGLGYVNSSFSAPQVNNIPSQQSAATYQKETHSNILNQAIANLLKEANNADVNGLINALQNGDVEMFRTHQSEQERKPNSAPCPHPGKAGNAQYKSNTKTSLGEGEASTSIKTSSRTTSSHTDHNDEGNDTKNLTKGQHNGVAFDQYDSANISSEETSSSNGADWNNAPPLKKRMKTSSSKNYTNALGHSSNK